MSRVVSIHQPYYFPWLGYLEKIAKSDVFIILDDVQYEKDNFYNRNRIRTNNGWSWLTVPIHHNAGMDIRDVSIANSNNWQKKHFKNIKYNYGPSKFYSAYDIFFRKIYKESHWMKLIDLNKCTIKFLMEKFNLKTELVYSSECKTEGKSTEKLINLCKYVGGDVYYSGSSGKDYLDIDFFTQSNIELIYQNYKCPEYSQNFEGFVENLSSLDYLLNIGPNSIKLFK